MAISFVDSAIGGTNPTTSTTVTIPAGTQANDLLFLVTVSRDATTTPPSVADDDVGGNTWDDITENADSRHTVWWKRATADTASKTITISSAVGSLSTVLGVWRGCSTSETPYESVSVEADGNATHATVTTSVDGSLVALSTHASNDTVMTVEPTATDPASIPMHNQHLSNGGSDCAAHLCSAVRATAGATGTITWTQGSITSSVRWVVLPAVGEESDRTTHNTRSFPHASARGTSLGHTHG